MKHLLHCLIAALALLSINFQTLQAAHLQENLLVTAKLSGDQEVPAVTTNAAGVATFTINSTRDTICVNVTVSGLSGPIVGAHIHEGAAGSNGPVITNLTPFINDNRIVATLTGANVSMDKIANYLSKAYYINVHTAANPGGEIRGQLMLETDIAFRANLDTAQETHIVNNNANGLGAFVLSQDKRLLEFNVVVDGLSGPITGAHFHTGATGIAGPVAVNVTSFINGPSIKGKVDVSGVAGFVSNLMAGNIYFNVHTASNPMGEVRGQVMIDNRLTFDSNIDTLQEMPAPSGTNGVGVGYASIVPTLDTLYYDFQLTGMSGAITGAHFHAGSVGSNGPVLINLTSGISGNRVSGVITGASLSTTNINTFLTGGIYVNFHTAANPAGEVRGQVYRNVREAYTYSIDAFQEVPASGTNGSGSGMVSIDRDQSNAHFMMVVNDLTGPLTGAHFHNAVAGVNGPVVFNLTSFFMPTSSGAAAFGYWTEVSSPAFMTANSVMFRNDAIYTNFHTSANPGGEIRGQVIRGAECFDQPCIAPANLSVTSLKEKSATLNWTQVPEATGYTITGGVVGNINSVSISVGAVSSVKVTGLTPGETYVWRIRTNCGTGMISAFSEVDTFTTINCVAPNPVATSNITSNSAVLNWTVVGDASGYRVSGGIVGGSVITIDVNNGNTSSLTASGLTSGTSYNWAVQAFCPGFGFSPLSNIETFTTTSATAKTTVSVRPINVYPNPADDNLSVTVPSLNEDQFELVITDLTGKELVNKTLRPGSGNTYNINVDHLSNGIYQMIIRGNNEQMQERIIIAR